MATISTDDVSTRFLFTTADVRGELVSLGPAFRALIGDHNYSNATAALLGQFAVAAVLISNNLKYQGRIVLQARSESALSLLMVECSSERHIRGVARGDTTRDAVQPIDLLADGQLAITIERDGGQRYQGIVALDGHSLAAALDGYFLQSEQLQTQFYLATDAHRAAGLMLQQLPPQIAQDAQDRAEQWAQATVVAETITEDELLQLGALEVLHRLYHDQPLEVFPPQAVAYQCRCTRQRSQDALNLLPVEELEQAFTEDGVITMTCDMCGAVYSFAREDLPTLAENRILH